MVDKSKFVNHFEIDPVAQQTIAEGWGAYPSRHFINIPDTLMAVERIDNLLTPPIVELLKGQLNTHRWLAVGLDGRSDHTYEEIGNYRLSNWNPELAERLWQRLAGFYGDLMLCDSQSPTDHDNHATWRPVGVSPLFRYIRYVDEGKLVAHYDETFIESPTRRTLESLVIYLTTNSTGATRFLHDEQVGKCMDEYNFQDWDRAGLDNEIAVSIPPQAGSAIIFPHRLLHDSQPLTPGSAEKIIIRTDIMFERV